MSLNICQQRNRPKIEKKIHTHTHKELNILFIPPVQAIDLLPANILEERSVNR